MQPRFVFVVYIFFTSLFFTAQNWQPVNLNNKYNYRLNNAAQTLSTIWADSVHSNNIYLNKIVKVCDTCSHIHLQNFGNDSFYVWKNVCGFLQHKLIKNGNINFQFKGDHNFVIKLNMPLNAWWTYDTAAAIQAKITSATSQLVLSAIDSVKTIVLSSADTILISKNHGLLKFPQTYSTGFYYTLIGIEGINAGYTLSKFNAFFNFNVGDVFQYSVLDDDYTSFPPYFKRGIEKRTILAKQIIGDTLRYQVKLVKADSAWLGASPPFYTYTNSIISVDMIDSASHFTNQYPGQPVYFNNYFANTFLDTLISNINCEMNNTSSITKRIGIACPAYLPNVANPYGLAVYSHSISNLYLAVNSNLVFGREAKEHLGITSEIYNNYDYLKTSCLSAWQTASGSYGTILPDAQILSVNEFSIDDQFLIYPNPAKNHLTVYNNTGFSGNLFFYNSMGVLILQAKAGDENITIDTGYLDNGVYILIIENNSKKAFKKIVIQK